MRITVASMCFVLGGCGLLGPTTEETARAETVCDFLLNGEEVFPEDLARFGIARDRAEGILTTLVDYYVGFGWDIAPRKEICVAVVSEDDAKLQEFDSIIAGYASEERTHQGDEALRNAREANRAMSKYR